MTPEPGHLSVCIHCGAALWFDANLTLIAVTAAEWAAMDPETRALVERTREDVFRAHRAWQHHRAWLRRLD